MNTPASSLEKSLLDITALLENLTFKQDTISSLPDDIIHRILIYTVRGSHFDNLLLLFHLSLIMIPRLPPTLSYIDSVITFYCVSFVQNLIFLLLKTIGMRNQ